MSEPQSSQSSSPGAGGRRLTPDVVITESDGRFFQSLHEFIDHEKVYLRCPEEGPHETRYIIYRSVFNKVIGRATAYKRLLLAIKSEYDDSIRELKRREDEEETSQRSVAASTSQGRTMKTCERRADQLRERISVVQKETDEVQEEIQRRRLFREQRAWIPGLTVSQSEDPDALERHLKLLEAHRSSLVDTKSLCVPLEIKNKLETQLQNIERRRERLSSENERLKVLFKRLRSVRECLTHWEEEEEEEKKVPLEELLSSLENAVKTNETDDAALDVQLFEDDEPRGVDESDLLSSYLDRFVELFDSDQFEDAALIAARAPRDVLRNLDTMQMFQDVEDPLGSVPPDLVFFWALLMTSPSGSKLSAPLSLHGVLCALRHGVLELVVHAVSQNKLTFSEALGDVLTEHAQKNPAVADPCLALATSVYEACRLDRKTALSMCRRGLVHSAAEVMTLSKDVSAEDCMWVLCRSPNLSLLQLLTEPQPGRAAILSVGVACASLLSDQQQHQELALQLLDGFISSGPGVLDQVILEDSVSAVDTWTDVASLCSRLNRADLSRAVLSVLLQQSGTRVLSPDLEGARLMEHVFL